MDNSRRLQNVMPLPDEYFIPCANIQSAHHYLNLATEPEVWVTLADGDYRGVPWFVVETRFKVGALALVA